MKKQSQPQSQQKKDEKMESSPLLFIVGFCLIWLESTQKYTTGGAAVVRMHRLRGQ